MFNSPLGLKVQSLLSSLLTSPQRQLCRQHNTGAIMSNIKKRLSEQYPTYSDENPNIKSFGELLLEVTEQGFLGSYVNRNLYLNDFTDIRFVDGQHPLNLENRLIYHFGSIYIPNPDGDGTFKDAYKVTEWFFDDTEEEKFERILWIRYEGDSVPEK
tara:strand:+ start:826 stop:1296 length:471 start_codon:yes stop_codon:yes gene_type:complete